MIFEHHSIGGFFGLSPNLSMAGSFWLISKDNYLFGSTRFQPGDKWYEEARAGQAFGNRRFWDCDGGGPGLCKPATKAPVRPMVYRLG